MMKKKISAFLLVAAIGIGSISADFCTRNFADTAITVQAAAPSASALAEAAKKPYGKNLSALYKLNTDENRTIDDEIKNRYGIEPSLYVSASAEISLMSFGADELAVFKAKDASSKKKILKAVKDHQKELKQSTMEYPMNLTKIQASRIYTNGNYVCYIQLGYISSKLETDGTEEEQIKAFQKLNKKAVKAIKKKLA